MELRDVIIVGAGPAGASCAKALKSEGIDVLVLEKAAVPRNKTCSGVLFGQTQELLQRYFGLEAPDDVYCSHAKLIRAEDVYEWDGQGGVLPYRFELDKDGHPFPRVYQNIWRSRFDSWLLEQSGAEYRDRVSVLGFHASAERVNIRTQSRNGESVTGTMYQSKYLVGADGTPSRMRHALTASSRLDEPCQTVSSLLSYCKILSLGTFRENGWAIFFLPEIGDILCAAHQKEEYLVMHVGGFKGRRLRDSMAKFKDLLSCHFGMRFGDCWREEGCQSELASPFLGAERVLLVGDAAGLVYLNGEGIAAAIDSGYRCGKAIAQALIGGGSARELYREGTKDIIAHMEKCMAKMHFFA